MSESTPVALTSSTGDVVGAAASDTMDPAVLSRAVALLTGTTGLIFPGGRRSTLRRALRTVAIEAGLPDAEALVRVLDHEPRLLARLVALVRIGETYFFRHPEQLAIVSERILPSLADAASGAGRRTIDIWSAGCSTGEEAYSLAILAAEVFGSSPKLQVRIAATDIDPETLRVAGAATYGRWSFRKDLGDRSRWFEADGALRRVRADIVRSVRFSEDNLSRDDGGLPAGLGGQPGLILCRNVTMYLSPEARRRVASRFLRLLAPGGWLIVAPVELASGAYAGFETTTVDGLTLYRRPPHGRPGRPTSRRDTEREPLGAAQSLSASDASSTHSPTQSSRVISAGPTASGRRSRPSRMNHGPARDDLAAARSWADEGRLMDARRSLEVAVRTRPSDRHGYLLLSSIAEAQDDLVGAAGALRRALYLDRSDPTAQFRLGLVEWRRGRIAQAGARLATAVRLVDGYEDERVLDAATDLTVGRLRSTARMLSHG